MRMQRPASGPEHTKMPCLQRGRIAAGQRGRQVGEAREVMEVGTKLQGCWGVGLRHISCICSLMGTLAGRGEVMEVGAKLQGLLFLVFGGRG